MAKEPVLVDSSYYIGEAREGRNPLRLLSYLAAERDLVICGVVRGEVGRGLRETKVRQAFGKMWDVMIQVNTDDRLWREVEDLAWSLDRRGIILPLTNVIIACCSARANAVVLTHDRHFAQIPGCKAATRVEQLI